MNVNVRYPECVGDLDVALKHLIMEKLFEMKSHGHRDREMTCRVGIDVSNRAEGQSLFVRVSDVESKREGDSIAGFHFPVRGVVLGLRSGT